MPPTTNFGDVRRFAAAIAAGGGKLPQPLKNLIAAHGVMAAAAGPPAPPHAAESSIIDAALDGSLDADKLAELLPAAALAAAVNEYAKGLGRNTEHVLLNAWHQKLDDGAADQILDSLRAGFDKHAAAIEKARSMIDPTSDPELILANADATLVAHWQGLQAHLDAVAKVAVVAKAFGPRMGDYPRIQEYSLADGFRISDTGLMLGGGPDITKDSAPFLVPDGPHRASAFFKVPLRLNSIAEAKSRYASFAADQWDRNNSGPVGGYLVNGQVVPMVKQENPYREKVST